MKLILCVGVPIPYADNLDAFDSIYTPQPPPFTSLFHGRWLKTLTSSSPDLSISRGARR